MIKAGIENHETTRNGEEFIGKAKFRLGFTLVEVLVAVTVFLVLAIGIYNAFASVSTLANVSRVKSEAILLANEQIEIIRNLPYSDVGITGGLPNGKIAHEQTINRDNIDFRVVTSIRNIDDPFDGTIGSSTYNDLTPADYKQAEVDIYCDNCRYYKTVELTTTIGPKNLETSSGNGALFVKVFDANGQPISGVNVRVQNASTTPAIDVIDTTNNDGLLQLVDVPPGNLAYKISVSKSGYSSARTYFSGESGITNPVNPPSTVLAGKLTQTSFSIDKLSNLNFKAFNSACQLLGPFAFELKGAKTLGTDPEVLKYDQSHTISSSGLLSISGVEWDTYGLIPQSSVYAIAGSFPLLTINVSPDSINNVSLVLTEKKGKGLLALVKDGATGLPLTGVKVRLVGTDYDKTRTTNRGFLNQTDWSGGSEQSNFGSLNKYEETDGNIETDEFVGEIKLKKILDHYVSGGMLTSSIFDTGTASTTFYNIDWLPVDQATSTGENSIKVQLASGNDSATTTWNFVGPDGTASSFYTTSNTNVSNVHNNDRYIRYKIYLSTIDDNSTPNISDVSLTYGSECIPYGQIFFDELSAGIYEVVAEKSGYQSFSGQVTINDDWQSYDITLTPQ